MGARLKNPTYKSQGISISLRRDQILALHETGKTPSSVVGAAVDQYLELTPPPQYLDETKPPRKKR